MKVYVVEDSDAVRERLVTMISEIGRLEVVGQASNFKEALEGIARHQPDMVLLDITLPDGTGIDLLARIKAQRPETRVFMVTSHSYTQYREKCRAAGADYFFNKTRDFEEIRRALGDVADGAPPAHARQQ